jgi:membrane-bound lytic murein transglycosylase D
VLAPGTNAVDLQSRPDQPSVPTVPAPAKIDVKLAARLAGMTEEEFIALNPSHRKPVAVSSTRTLVVPVDKAEAFKENLENYDKPLVTWTTYTAKRGESLNAIAHRNGVGIAQLKSVNDPFKLDRKGRLRLAGPILVPMRNAKSAAPTRLASVSVPTVSAAGAPHGGLHATVRWHIVKAGETLYRIAQRYDTAVETLRSVNRLGVRSVIQPGLRLRLP